MTVPISRVGIQVFDQLPLFLRVKVRLAFDQNHLVSPYGRFQAIDIFVYFESEPVHERREPSRYSREILLILIPVTFAPNWSALA
jgi:hypothetical protein